jgi:hypothetical protein
MHRLACLVFATAAALPAWDVNGDLLDAARRGDLDTVKALIEKGAVTEHTRGFKNEPANVGRTPTSASDPLVALVGGTGRPSD